MNMNMNRKLGYSGVLETIKVPVWPVTPCGWTT